MLVISNMDIWYGMGRCCHKITVCVVHQEESKVGRYSLHLPSLVSSTLHSFCVASP